MNTANPIKCKAKSHGTGEPCKMNAIPGGTVCRYHGGLAPQVARKAAERIAALRDDGMTLLAAQLAGKDIKPGTTLAIVRDLTELLLKLEDREAGEQARSAVDDWLRGLKEGE